MCVQAYGDRAAHLQCLPHKQLRALTHHHGARGAHGHGSGDFEHGGYAVAMVEWRVGVASSSSWVEALSLERFSSSSAHVGGCWAGNRRIANWLCGVKAQSDHRHPHNFTDALSFCPSHCRRPNPLHFTAPPAIMSDNENGDELVTKPFKFVTGKLPRPPNCV